MRILVTGMTGGLGGALCRHFRQAGHTVVGTWNQKPSPEGVQLDLLDRKNVSQVFSAQAFDACFHTAAIADPDFCEAHPELAHAINVTGSSYIKQSCEENGVKPVFFSTDYVFSGRKPIYTEEDAPDPLQVYGRTKVEAEDIFLQDPQSVVLRIGLLYDDRHGPFKALYQKLCDGNAEITLSKKQVRYPLHIKDVCFYAEKILQSDVPPLLHLTGPDPYTKYESGVLIAGLSGSGKTISVDDNDVKLAARPDHVCLSLDRINGLLPYQATRFETGIRNCLPAWKLAM